MSVVSNIRIEYQYIVYFCISEDCFLIVVLHIRRHQYCTFYLNTAFFRITFFIQLSQQAFQHIVIFVSVYFIVFTSTLSIHLHLVIDHFIRYFDCIVIYFIFSTYFCFKFRCQSDIEYKFEFFHCIEVDHLLFFFVRQRFAQHVHLIFFNIVVNSFLQYFIHFFCNH